MLVGGVPSSCEQNCQVRIGISWALIAPPPQGAPLALVVEVAANLELTVVYQFTGEMVSSVGASVFWVSSGQPSPTL